MSRSINNNLEKLRRQLSNGTNVNVLINKPRRVITKKVVTRNKKVAPKVKKVQKSSSNLQSKKLNETSNFYWNFLYAMLVISVLFLFSYMIYSLYFSFKEGEQQAIIDQTTTNQVEISNNVENAPKGVIIDQEGAPISIEKGGNMAGNKYLALYGGDDYITRSTSPWRESSPYAPYAPYPGRYSGYNDYNVKNKSPYYSQTEDGVTKIYYKNVMSSERQNLNNYIENQNDYIRSINDRVRQINTGRMYTPTYSRDKAVLSELRNYERRLANKVNKETKNQPYLPDQTNYYQ